MCGGRGVDKDGWGEAMDEQQWRSGQATPVDGGGRWRLSEKDDSGESTSMQQWRSNNKFFFLGGFESYLKSYLDESCPKLRVFFLLFYWGG
jgi:hypothetical protein